ncbi:MAG TPA: YceI family protein, partial [Lentimicrobium sp.]|nr:YceI family protein [Lentimicrobium sp.]
MKNFSKILSLIVVTGLFAACGGPQGEKALTGDAQAVSVMSGDVTLNADLETSIIEWEGAKPTGTHNGTIELTEGQLFLDEGNVVGGKFVIDMNSIVVLDLTDPDMNGKLLGHLKSADFFETETYPTATFEITSVEAVQGNPAATHNITGNLSMKDVTRSVTFPATVNVSDNGVTATSATFLIDRTQWNVQYGSKTLFANL